MRRFLMTSRTVFNGEIEILFDSDGRLVKFDVMSTDMPPEIVRIFKDKVPVFVDDLHSSFKNTVTIVEASVRISFDQWWSKYDKKINKKRCVPLYKKLSDADTIKAFFGVDPYDKFLKGLPYQRPKADPEKYLKDRYWENEWK